MSIQKKFILHAIANFKAIENKSADLTDLSEIKELYQSSYEVVVERLTDTVSLLNEQLIQNSAKLDQVPIIQINKHCNVIQL